MSRQVRMAWSDGRPSRRKNEPGIFPAAYIRSSMSTVSGKKSMPSRTPLAALAVTRTMVSPMRPTTAPCDCGARTPVSNERVLSVPLIGPEMVTGFATVAPLLWSGTRASSQWSGTRAHALVPHDWQLTSRPRSWVRFTTTRAALRPLVGCCWLPAKPEAGDDLAVALDVVLAHVVEEAAPAADQLHETPAGVVVAFVHLQVLGEVG